MPGVQMLPVGQAPMIVIDEIEGDFQVTGWDRPELQVRGVKADEVSRRGNSTRSLKRKRQLQPANTAQHRCAWARCRATPPSTCCWVPSSLTTWTVTSPPTARDR